MMNGVFSEHEIMDQRLALDLAPTMNLDKKKKDFEKYGDAEINARRIEIEKEEQEMNAMNLEVDEEVDGLPK
jgi:hypothetical protein